MISKFIHLFVLILSLMFTMSVTATDFTVTSLADTTTGSGTSGTLRWCIGQANAAGTGPHTITFASGLTGGTIILTSNLPTITVPNLTIDGIGNDASSITINRNTNGVANTDIFNIATNAHFTTIRNFHLIDFDAFAIEVNGNPTDITIENIIAFNTFGDKINNGIRFIGNANKLTVRNFNIKNLQNGSDHNGIRITGTSTDVLIDNFNLSDSAGGSSSGIYFRSTAINVTIKNSVIEMGRTTTTNNGTNGIDFAGSVTSSIIDDVTISNVDDSGIDFGSTTNNIQINNLTVNNADLYGVHFTKTTDNVTINETTINDAQKYGIFFDDITTNVTITNSNFNNPNGNTNANMLYFRTTTSFLTITDLTINGDIIGTTNDIEYGIYFNTSHLKHDFAFSRVNISHVRVHGIRFRKIDELTVNNSTFSYCGNSGIAFDSDGTENNAIITNSTFDHNTKSGLAINLSTSTSKFDIQNNTFSNNTAGDGYGIWLFGTNAVRDVQIQNNVIFNNNIGIRNEQADGILFSENSIYNNNIGIENNNNGNNGLTQADNETPVITSSINTALDTYNLTFTLPATCTNCEVEIYNNLGADIPTNGRNFRKTVSGISAANNPHTVSVNSGGNNTGFWTATLKDNGQNGSVSEFSKGAPILVNGPANVVSGIALWARADITGMPDGTLNGTNKWLDYSGNQNHYQVKPDGDPILVNGKANFNRSVTLDGNDYFSILNSNLNRFPSGNDNRSLFIVANVTVTTEKSVFDYGTNRTSNSSQSFIYNLDNTGSLFYGGFNNNFDGSNAFTPNTPFIARFDHENSVAGIYSNGKTISTASKTYATDISIDDSYIGTRSGYPDERFVGDISEIIQYNRKLTQSEINRIESYLAIKYGITLDQSISVNNYVASDGTIIWNATNNAGYNNSIAGIGRDDITVLNQKQSRSVNPDDIITMGLGSIEPANDANTNNFSTDKNYLIWGNDASGTTVVNTGIPTAFTEKISRNWLVKETGSVGNTLVQLPNSAISGFTNGGTVALFIADDPGFNTNLVKVPLVQNGVNWQASHDFNGTKYLAIGKGDVQIQIEYMRHGKFFANGTEQPMSN